MRDIIGESKLCMNMYIKPEDYTKHSKFQFDQDRGPAWKCSNLFNYYLFISFVYQ